jgi:hypothetical protein
VTESNVCVWPPLLAHTNPSVCTCRQGQQPEDGGGLLPEASR